MVVVVTIYPVYYIINITEQIVSLMTMLLRSYLILYYISFMPCYILNWIMVETSVTTEFISDSVNTTLPPLCGSSPCQNDGVCIEINNNTDYTCICPGGYSIKYCPGIVNIYFI